MYEENPRDIFCGKQKGTENQIHMMLSRIKTGVLDVEVNEKYHYTDLTAQINVMD